MVYARTKLNFHVFNIRTMFQSDYVIDLLCVQMPMSCICLFYDVTYVCIFVYMFTSEFKIFYEYFCRRRDPPLLNGMI